MASTRRKFTPEEKARLVLEILKEEKSIAQLASEHGIHTNVLNRWKTKRYRIFRNYSSTIAKALRK
ncbi:transposase [Paenibacillus sedimenti]|uniref:Transposase n=1 Tax=Paenibacillus sedimenti TaxID=2770274 RepID=A0A926KVN6_9BACL|nr:transposase [Paenibacillus sedimenti]